MISPKFCVSVPGKIILMGEHSVLYKKVGIATAIGRRTRLEFREIHSKGEDFLVDLKSLDWVQLWKSDFIRKVIQTDKPLSLEKAQFSLTEPQLIDHDKFLTSIRENLPTDLSQQISLTLSGVLYLVSAMFWSVALDEEDLLPFKIVLSSELSVGAGTGSSASFSVALSSAIYHYIKLKASSKFGTGMHNISAPGFAPCTLDLLPVYSGFSKVDKDIINKWAYCIEKVMHGKPSGLDNTVCTFGGAVVINANPTDSKVPNFELLESLPSLRVVLVNSKVPRNTAVLVKKVANLYALCPAAMDSVLNSMDTVAKEFIRLLQKLQCEINFGKNTELVYSQLEGLMDIQQGLLTSIGVSHIRLDEICHLGQAKNLHFKLTGAGGGGFAFALIPPNAAKEMVDQCLLDLEANGFQVQQVDINAKGLELSNLVES